MNEENKQIFLLQAEKIVKEILEQIAEDLFISIDVRDFENQFQTTDSSELQASAFYSIIVRDQLLDELQQNKTTAFISNSFTENNIIRFFLIKYDNKKEKLIQKYQTFCTYLTEAIFDFLLDEWNKENFYFYNSSISSIILRNAIDNLVTEVSKKCCGYNDIALYENINLSMLNILSDLSYQTYEKTNTEGLIYFTDNPLNAEYQFKFENPDDFGNFSQTNQKLLRKLLELTSPKKELGIITDSNKIYGIGKIKEGFLNYNVSFEDDHKWILSKDDVELITMKENSLLFMNTKFTYSDFASYATKVFPELEDKDECSELHSIIKSLIKQQKGTILVVMKDAQKYIENYRDLAILIDPVKLDEKNVEKLSSIDGAIIIDQNCICYGFGAVLDGIDTGSGNRARGSRYNSSERFYNYYKNKDNAELFVFVLSDDGNYNFFPNKE